ncbi:MAG: 23S rRNA (guanosine(2251)-2'-O)-methyltransferase RlmB [Desulfamplus sp.]|nr:23S rRNA (guanosine(2251)-2'-O)-methyltransferase RlmB [Desulfamplus sp.]
MTYEILCGVHSVLEALKAQRRSFSRIYIAKERTLSRLNEILDLAGKKRTEVEFVSIDFLDKMSSGVKHQGIIAKATQFPVRRAESDLKARKAGIDFKVRKAGIDLEARKEGIDLEARKAGIDLENSEYNTQKKGAKKDKTDISNGKKEVEHTGHDSKNKFIVVLESIEDPHNLGAIIRTALCAGVDQIVIPKDRSVQPSPAVSRASAGAMEHADILIVTNIASYLRSIKKNGVWVAGLDAQGDTDLFSSDLTGNIAIVVGGEHQGIRPLVKKECDFLISLPLAQGITSLNASVACGIALYEVVRQRGFTI